MLKKITTFILISTLLVSCYPDSDTFATVLKFDTTYEETLSIDSNSKIIRMEKNGKINEVKEYYDTYETLVTGTIKIHLESIDNIPLELYFSHPDCTKNSTGVNGETKYEYTYQITSCGTRITVGVFDNDPTFIANGRKARYKLKVE